MHSDDTWDCLQSFALTGRRQNVPAYMICCAPPPDISLCSIIHRLRARARACVRFRRAMTSNPKLVADG